MLIRIIGLILALLLSMFMSGKALADEEIPVDDQKKLEFINFYEKIYPYVNLERDAALLCNICLYRYWFFKSNNSEISDVYSNDIVESINQLEEAVKKLGLEMIGLMDISNHYIVTCIELKMSLDESLIKKYKYYVQAVLFPESICDEILNNYRLELSRIKYKMAGLQSFFIKHFDQRNRFKLFYAYNFENL